MLTSGSIHVRPVSMMAMPASTTPADTAASAAICRNAPRRFASLSRPRMKSNAVSVLTATPTAATAIITGPATGSGDCNRCHASQTITPQAVSSKTALASAA